MRKCPIARCSTIQLCLPVGLNLLKSAPYYGKQGELSAWVKKKVVFYTSALGKHREMKFQALEHVGGVCSCLTQEFLDGLYDNGLATDLWKVFASINNLTIATSNCNPDESSYQPFSVSVSTSDLPTCVTQAERNVSWTLLITCCLNLFEDISNCIKDVFEYYNKEKALVLIIIVFVLLKQRC